MNHYTKDELSEEDVEKSRTLHGSNVLTDNNNSGLLEIIKEILSEPLFILLVFTSVIYFTVGEYKEGIIMIIALLFVAGISLFQEARSRGAIDSLKKLSSPKVKVIRSGKKIWIMTEELVVGDIMFLDDGNLVPADAKIIEQHDFSVDQSILTGESLPITKNTDEGNDIIYRGTNVVTGNCTAVVTFVGNSTEIGKIGLSLEQIDVVKTPLQLQIKRFTKSMVFFGVLAFISVILLTYMQTNSWVNSILKGLTLAMSVLPEEIPVAFSTFMALGAYHLYKKGVIAKSPYTVETLGAATVICTDKTGTITQNVMELVTIFDFGEKKMFDFTDGNYAFSKSLELAMWASEPEPTDRMEISIHHVYSKVAEYDKRKTSKLIFEYALGGNPPMMTHVFRHHDGSQTIAVKGSAEGILQQSDLSDEDKTLILEKVEEMASKGFRVLAIGESDVPFDSLPKDQHEIKFKFAGLAGFYDPPKDNIKKTIKSFYDAGIQIKMLTGDQSHTASAIAKMAGIKNYEKVLEGDAIMKTDLISLRNDVKDTNIFARMFPEAKLKIIEAFKLNGEVVAMTGDGVNDAPALKAAHIGVAMGQGGSDVAKSVAGLILMDDDLRWMTDAIELGRKIYGNLKKAIRYIISIHIPIILIVAVPLFFSWSFTDIFLPIHVIFLELIMGPTCSVIYENEPGDPNLMHMPPRKSQENLFSFKELLLSIIQGLIITVACLGLGYYFLSIGEDGSFVRSIIYTTLLFSNIFLTLENRSFYQPVTITIKYKNRLIPLVLAISFAVLLMSLYLKPVRDIFGFKALDLNALLLCFGIAAVSVFWIEIYKYLVRKNSPLKTRKVLA